MTDIQAEEGQVLVETNYTYDMPESNFSPTLITIQTGWYSFVFTLGVIGNVYIILTVVSRTSRSSATNLFIVNLAISDLLVLLICLPIMYTIDYFSWPFGKMGCRLLIPLNEVFFTVSILTLTVITLERHRAIVYPFKAKLGRKAAKVIVVFVWIVSYLAVGFPLTFVIKEVQPADDEFKCNMEWPSVTYSHLHTAFIALLVIIPLFIVAFGYVLIIMTMRKQSERIKKRTSYTTNLIGSSSSYVQDMHTLDENKKLIKMLIVLVVIFWLCMLPLVLLALVVEFHSVDYSKPKTMKLIEGLYTFTTTLFFTNSAFNPVAIYIMSSEMRKGFYGIQLGFKSCRR